MPICFDEPTLCWRDAAGQWHEIQKGIETITIATGKRDIRYLPGIDLARGESYTATCKWTLPHINRKQFCRELVKLGYPKKTAKAAAAKIKRNYANHLALARIFGESYVDKLTGGGG